MYKKIIPLVIFIFILSISSVFADVSYEPINIAGNHIVEDNEELSSVSNTFVLTAKNNAPMPKGSENGIKEVTIPANNSFDFGSIAVTKPGTYEYTISRKTTPSERLFQDNSVYNARIAVFSDGSQVVIYQKEGESAKADKIEYKDTYLSSLSFDLNGGELDGKTGSVTLFAKKGDVIRLPGAPKKEGYVFDYWKGSRYEAGAKYKVGDDHKFTAMYKVAGKTGKASGTDEKAAVSGNGKTGSGSDNSTSGGSQTGDEMKLLLSSLLAAGFLTVLLVSGYKKRQN